MPEPHEFFVPCYEDDEGRLVLCPVGGACGEDVVSKGDVCVVVGTVPCGGWKIARVRNLTRGGCGDY